ncbi:MAG: hypothetical protein CO189_01190 [candidate division Zixibacteria bacterium CG_4_9_14_3_um_filter_46_8]|nr:MAG: hypothetical protein CO189_01190 [candidate division Zixibacteria bacterium CG_4_9_14_3_um_filter_46_8]
MPENQKPKALLKIKIGKQVREVTYEELTLSNNLATEALLSLLIDKGVIDPEEYLKKIQDVRKERYRDESEFK